MLFFFFFLVTCSTCADVTIQTSHVMSSSSCSIVLWCFLRYIHGLVFTLIQAHPSSFLFLFLPLEEQSWLLYRSNVTNLMNCAVIELKSRKGSRVTPTCGCSRRDRPRWMKSVESHRSLWEEKQKSSYDHQHLETSHDTS